MGIDGSAAPTHASFPTDATLFATARAGLAAILDTTQPTCVHAPAWICDTALVAARERGLPVHAYPIDTALRPRLSLPADDDALVILVDYFGVVDLPSWTGLRIVVDATQAWDRVPVPGRWTVKSARKLFGVPDGAPVWGPRPLPPPPRAAAHTTRHLVLRGLGDEAALAAARQHEAALSTAPLAPSPESHALLRTVDQDHHRATRRAHFRRLHARLGAGNRLQVELGSGMPLAYPYLPPEPIPLGHFHRARIWVPQLWAERTDDPDPWAAELSRALRPLPVDPRLTAAQVDHIAEVTLRGLDRAQVQ